MSRGGFVTIINQMAREADQAQRNRIREIKQCEKKRATQEKEDAIWSAKEKTLEANKERDNILNILPNTKPITISFEDYKETGSFPKSMPKPNYLSKIKKNYSYPIKEKVKFSIKERLFKELRERKTTEHNKKFQKKIDRWHRLDEIIKKDNEKVKLDYEQTVEAWNNRRKAFEKNQKIKNKKIDLLKHDYMRMKKEGVEFYFNKVLKKSEYPKYYIKKWGLEYDPETKIIIINHALPPIGSINNIKEVKYIISRNAFKETYLKPTEINSIYNNAIIQLCLRVTHDIYTTDIAKSVTSIVFNGWLTDVDRSIGKEETKCIISLQTTRDEFLKINIKKVDPSLCFKRFKGRSAAKISELVPIAPIAIFNKKDRRFVDGHDVAAGISGMNIASMHWEEFEHLIRELFEKEFCKNGAEIKITQASRDGGVDAVMFDPDPIRGGKIIIQAKRYTNTVGVSAVRDLYGTVMNEGASKGILVTTSNYGADSYNFAKNKPLTLLNGSNLLHLLEENGFNAKIDLIEAKMILSKQEETRLVNHSLD